MTLLIEHFLKTIWFSVSVPVLSVSTYSIWPRSSARVEQRACANDCDSASYISMSQSIHFA